MDLFTRGPKTKWKTWSSLWRAVPLLILAWILWSRASAEKNAASMQQTSYGTITDCERSGRGGGGGYYCHYVFEADGEQYKGGSHASAYFKFGQTVVVYHVSQDPGMNSLVNFASQSRSNKHLAYIFLLLTAAPAAFVLYSKATARKGSEPRTT